MVNLIYGLALVILNIILIATNIVTQTHNIGIYILSGIALLYATISLLIKYLNKE